MSTTPGIYKDNTTSTPDYEGCTESYSLSDSTVITDQDLEIAIDNYYPEVMRDSQFNVFTDLLAEEASQVSANSNLVRSCYNLDNIDDDMMYRISSLYDIQYPLDYSAENLKLLFKNYEKIRKVRGERKSIIMLLRVLDRSEKNLYEEDSDDTTITEISPGYYRIHNSRITNVEFAEYMIKKVIRSGIQFEFDNSTSHQYSCSAVTQITSKYDYDPFTDSKVSMDDEKKSSSTPLILDRRGIFEENYSY